MNLLSVPTIEYCIWHIMSLRLIRVEDGDSSGNSMSWRPRSRACSSRRL